MQRANYKAPLSMGAFTAVGMRQSVDSVGGCYTVNTCSENDTDRVGDLTHWSWSNPTNRRFPATHSNDPTCTAVSVECLWQGTKIATGAREPNPAVLAGNWRAGKGKRPLGAWNGPGNPLIVTPGAARRAIYIPAYVHQIWRFLNADDQRPRNIVRYAAALSRTKTTVFLRDFDTGRGVDRNGPMSHAWLLATILNGQFENLGQLDANTTQRINEIHRVVWTD